MTPTAAIVTIGDEILIGQVTDTNATFISSVLGLQGWQITERVTVPDDTEKIQQAISRLMKQNNLVLTTGGLGPTRDDKTKDALVSLLGTTYRRDIATQEKITTRARELFKEQLTPELLDINLRQADIPASAEALDNSMGAAPGIWVSTDSCILVSMPGVPFEMKALMNEQVLPRLQNLYQTGVKFQTIIVSGIAESKLSMELQDYEDQLPEHMNLAYLPSMGYLKLRLTTYQPDSQFQEYFEDLRLRIHPYFICEGDNLLHNLVQHLIYHHTSVSTAESCTGGALASMLCNESGASSIFQEGIITYANDVKIKKLHVHPDTISKFGAVSEECVIEMARGQLASAKSDYAIAISGILGPTGGGEDKPIGTVWMAIAHQDNVWTHHIKGRWDRIINKEYTLNHALVFLWRIIHQQSDLF